MEYYQRFIIGMDNRLFDEIFSFQKGINLCWAACLEMIIRLTGFEASQLEFAAETCGMDRYGNPFDCPAYNEDIDYHLNSCWDEQGLDYCLRATMKHGSPNLTTLYNLLGNESPVIVAYRERGMEIGHVVVITGLIGYWLNGTFIIERVIIRDPAPDWQNVSARGYKEKDARTFLNTITAHWTVELRVSTHEAIYALMSY